MSSWSPADMPDQSGRVAVVTGANSGLGFEVARRLTQAGAHVVLACRDQTRGRHALDRLRTVVSAASAQLVRLDLADLASIRECAEQVGDEHAVIDLLVNNAGVMALPRRQTVDGFEMQFGTNHLGHFAFTGRLLPRLLARPGARVVTVTSFLSHLGQLDFTDLHAASGRYHKWKAYTQSKLANLMFAVELQRRLSAAGLAGPGPKDQPVLDTRAGAPPRPLGLISVAAHPGFAATHLQAAGPEMAGRRVSAAVIGATTRVLAQSAAAGAQPLLYAATAPQVRGGELYGPRFLEYRGAPHRAGGAARAYDPAAAELLWEESEQETGVRYESLGAPA